jgi:dihydrofolate reductase
VKAGLLDEIRLSVVRVILGGVRLLDNLDRQQFALECAQVVESDGVTHLRYRVLK